MSRTNHHHQPVLARAHKHRTLCDLPVELLSIIVSQIKDDRRTLRACTVTCPYVRAVAIKRLFSTSLLVTEVASFDGLLSFLQDNPAICKKTRTLALEGATRETKADLSVPLTKLDAAVVSRLLQLLRNLLSLRFRGFVYSLPPQPTSTPPPALKSIIFLSRSTSISRLSFDSTFCTSIVYAWHHKSPISGLLRIISLFSIHELSVGGNVGGFKPSTPFNPAVLHGLLNIKKLQFDRCKCSDRKCSLLLINAFAESIAPGCLQSLSTHRCSMATISAIGKLLARGGAGLTSFDIDADAPDLSMRGGKWTDPLDSHWHRLDLASCPKLESLVTNIHFRPPAPNPSNIPALSLAGAGMLSQTSATLRRAKICLWDLPRATTLNNRQMLRLQELDKVITVERFSHLEEVVRPEYIMKNGRVYKWQQIVGGVQKALPGLQARGLLTVRGR